MNKISLFRTILVIRNGEQIDKLIEPTCKQAEIRYQNLLLYGYLHPITQKVLTDCKFTLL
jgi:hypothetical protein